MYKINLKTAMVDEVGITFSEKLVEYADMGSLKNINTYFYFVDEDTLIFYDYNMEAFRILSENKIEIEEFVPPTFNVAAYYTFLKKFDASKYEG